MSFEKRLKSVIKEERYSQREFAEMVGVPLRSIENYVAGKREPTSGVIERIATHPSFEKYALWLVTGTTAPDGGQVCPSFSTLEQCGLADDESQKQA